MRLLARVYAGGDKPSKVSYEGSFFFFFLYEGGGFLGSDDRGRGRGDGGREKRMRANCVFVYSGG